jgi:beta-galactosidase/beta-glucuronidase
MIKALSFLYILPWLILPAKYADAQPGSSAQSALSVNLAGEWQFRQDPLDLGFREEWFKKTLHDQVKLPGTCEEQGYGVKNMKPVAGRLTKLIRYEGHAWYQRVIAIPENWNGKRTELFLERCMWESSVWVDDQRIGTENSLSTPHLYDLGVLSPGNHRLTICIDNTYKLPIGTWAHAVTEDTQGRWNGIIGRIELRATDPLWIRNAQVFPDQIRVNVGNQTGRSQEAVLQSVKCTIPAGGATINIPFTEKEQTWDEFSPIMHNLTITLSSGSFHDQQTVRFAVRKIGTQNRQFTMNGKPVLFRGPVDECIYPLTGYPPMDKSSWMHVLNICRS